MIKNGVILAGGKATRLAPFNKFISKNLMNINGRCVIDYCIDTLKYCGVENLTVVVGPPHSGQIIDYIQDGSQYGLNINFVHQNDPLGIAHAINLCEKYVDDKFITILGDNIFSSPLDFKSNDDSSAKIVLYEHQNLKRFGVASLDGNKIIKIEEKPQMLDATLQNYAITGCYLFDKKYFEYFTKLVPSGRNEFEITDIIRQYHSANELGYVKCDHKSMVWLDAGTHESIAAANNYFYSLGQIKNGQI